MRFCVILSFETAYIVESKHQNLNKLTRSDEQDYSKLSDSIISYRLESFRVDESVDRVPVVS